MQLRRVAGIALHRAARLVRNYLANRSTPFFRDILRKAALVSATVFAILYGTAVCAQSPVDLVDVRAETGGFAIAGLNPDDRSGWSVAGNGDFNGDGHLDLAIGAYNASIGENSVGKVYVLFGPFDGGSIDLADIAAGNNGFVINGFYDGGESGRSLHIAGDVNADGKDDLIIGGPGNNGSGEAYVVFGSTQPGTLDLSALGNAGFAILGNADAGFAGWSVGAAGDFNGDGLDDVIVGAYRESSNGDFWGGKAYVVFGKQNATNVDLALVESGVGGVLIKGEGIQALTGYAVSGAGDVNNDGKDDVIVGAPQRPASGGGTGQAFVVFGTTSTSPIDIQNVVSGFVGFVIHGVSSPSRAGYAVAAAGDINGDGFDDVIVGAPGSGTSTGRAYVVFGKVSTIAVFLSGVTAGNGGFAITGDNASGRAGARVAGAGDVNGDGLPDVIVGAPEAGFAGRALGGISYVVYGKTTGTLVDLADVENGTGGFAIAGAFAGDESGRGLSAAGDLNNDCLCDTVVGAPFADPASREAAGETYVVFTPSQAAELFAEAWVDFNHGGASLGTEENPYTTLQQAICFAGPDAVIRVRAGATSETITIDKPVSLNAEGGIVSIGHAPSR